MLEKILWHMVCLMEGYGPAYNTTLNGKEKGNLVVGV